MTWTNYHTHTHFSDGKTEPIVYLNAAIEAGVTQYGFSDHAPFPVPMEWAMKQEDYPKYLKTIKELKTQFAGKIEVLLSMEIDYLPDVMGVHQFKDDLDYTVSSVHFGPLIAENQYWIIDGLLKDFLEGLDILFGGDMKKGVAKYFEHTQRMILEDTPDILGHMDKIKMHNRHQFSFSEDEKWYRDLVMDTLKVIAEKGVIVELNTRGFYKKLTETFYPSDWVLKAIRDLKIPVVINSDGHHPKEVVKGFVEAKALLQELGFKEVMRYQEGSFIPVALE